MAQGQHVIKHGFHCLVYKVHTAEKLYTGSHQICPKNRYQSAVGSNGVGELDVSMATVNTFKNEFRTTYSFVFSSKFTMFALEGTVFILVGAHLQTPTLIKKKNLNEN